MPVFEPHHVSQAHRVLMNELKKKLGVRCDCNDPFCAECLAKKCTEDQCPVHSLEGKKASRGGAS